MEKINNIFLNYKTYNAFQRDLTAEKISPTSIAFIEDNRRIWAHGKEYACNNLTVVDNGEGSISFVDSLGNTLLALSADPNGYVNVSGITGNAYDVFISRGDFANYVGAVEQLKQDFERFKSTVNLQSVVQKKDLLEDVIEGSDGVVKSKAIYRALDTKLDKLIAGAGISIQNNVISAQVDERPLNNMVTLTQIEYDRLVENDLVDADTYYFTYEGTPKTGSWHFGDPFPIILTDTWEFGGTFPITLS